MKLLIFFALALVSVSAFDLRNDKLPAVQISSRMTNAQDASINKFPYLVDITQSDDSTSPYASCGGSLIDHEWVLTAGHCVDKHDSVIINMGSSNRSEPAVKYTVYEKDFIIHPDFVPFPITNDIALIKIPYTNYTKNLQKITLPAIEKTYSSYVGKKVIASVWGLDLGEYGPASTIATELKWEHFNVISNEQCNKSYSLFGIPPTVMCIATSDGVSPCTGDSGGPLVLEETKVQLGVHSFVSGGGCTIDWPAGFTRVTSFLQWIKDETGIFY